jgi:hypothetical protein
VGTDILVEHTVPICIISSVWVYVIFNEELSNFDYRTTNDVIIECRLKGNVAKSDHSPISATGL